MAWTRAGFRSGVIFRAMRSGLHRSMSLRDIFGGGGLTVTGFEEGLGEPAPQADIGP